MQNTKKPRVRWERQNEWDAQRKETKRGQNEKKESERDNCNAAVSTHSPEDMLRTALDEPTALERFTVTERDAKAAVGVPDRLPVAASNTRPVGKEGETENRAAGNPKSTGRRMLRGEAASPITSAQEVVP